MRLMKAFGPTRWRLLIFAAPLCLLIATSLQMARAATGAPQVVVSIAPIHALASAVMDGIGAPYLLVPPGGNAHQYTLRPSDARALANADYVFWIGSDLERFLDKPLKGIARRARKISLSDYVEKLPLRDDGDWEHHDHHAGVDDHKFDPHVWLDPENAKRMAMEIAKQLSKADPARSTVYERNRFDLARSIDRAARDVDDILASVRSVPYVVFHDEYQYFETRFGMNSIGTITISPERPPSVARISMIRRKVRESGATCVFYDSNFKPKLVATITRGGAAKSAPLDSVGGGMTPGPQAYPKFLRLLAQQLKACLAS
jgi:zinc transport system substrate-binding protein